MRRRLGSMAVLTAAIAGCAARSSTQPPASTATPAAATTRPAAHYTYLVAHGATAGGWEWKDVAARLLVDGHTMYRPSYTGLGDRAHLATPDVDLDTHITDLVNTILFEDLHDVVLVGHSYGGMVITGVADRVPDRIKTLVYVDALLPANGESLETARQNASTQPSTGPSTTPSLPPMTRGTLGQPFRPGQRPPYNVVQPPKTFSQPITLTHADQTQAIPAVYILTVDPGKHAEEDAFYGFAQRARQRGWTVWEMACDHVPSRSEPAEMTRLLEAAPAAARAGLPQATMP